MRDLISILRKLLSMNNKLKFGISIRGTYVYEYICMSWPKSLLAKSEIPLEIIINKYLI